MATDVMGIPTGTSNSDDLSDQRLGNDVELRELIYQSLECDGLMSRLKAELRAAVFKTIEKAANPTAPNPQSPAYEGTSGRICRALVLDWLEHSRLLYTEDVFKVETTGPNHPVPLTHTELLEQLHIKSNAPQSQPVLHALLNQNKSPAVSTITSLPAHIEQSINSQFPNEKINDLNRLREHFRSLFSSAFDSSVLDIFFNNNLPSTSSSFPKRDYEEICLKWMRACANALVPQTNPVKQVASLVPTQLMTSRSTVDTSPMVTQAVRSTSPTTESTSSSSSSTSTSAAADKRKAPFNFPLPTTIDSNKSAIKKLVDILPPPLINFDDKNSSDEDEEQEEEEEDTSASLFSKRNATPAELNRLKNMDNIIQGDEKARTRTTLQKTSTNGTRDLPIEYDDESMSQSVSHSIISSVDDVTVDKASTAAGNFDFLEDF